MPDTPVPLAPKAPSPPSEAADFAAPSRPVSLKRVSFAIALAYLCLVGMIGLATVALIAHDKRQEMARTEAELSSLTRALDEHVTRSFEQIDTVLSAVAGSVSSPGYWEANEETLHILAADWTIATAPVSRIEVLRPDGLVRASSETFPVPPGTTASIFPGGIPFTPGGMQIGRTQRGPDKDWEVPVRRRIVLGNGELVGFATASVRVSYFERFLSEIRISPDDAIAVYSIDGQLLLAQPEVAEAIGRNFLRTPLLDLPPPRTTVVRKGIGWQDGKQRIATSRALNRYALIVQVSRPERTAMRRFHDSTERIVWGACILAGLLGVLAWVVFEDVRRRETARRTLQRFAQKLELRVQQRTSELEASNRELVAFSYSVSHDLRAPLRAINGFAHALTEDYGTQMDATARDYLERIGRASVRMGTLIDELLKLANVTRQPLEIRAIDLSAMAEDIIADLRSTHPERKIECVIQSGMRATGDESLLRDVLGNLIDNAWKFTRERDDARIELGMRESGEHMLIWLADNGIGFDMSFAGRLFQPFQQLHAAQGYKGSGIGLASARRIIERHGGRIWVESEPGRGTTFLFTLARPIAVIRRRR